MGVLATAIGLAAVGSFGGRVLATGILFVRDDTRTRVVSILISYAVGTLLAVALLRLLPEALDELPPRQVLGSLLVGIFSFFVLEKLVIWSHCHETGECNVHDQTASLVMMGDAVHTFVDGAIIAAAVLTSVPFGVTTAVAAAAHEIPQEIGPSANWEAPTVTTPSTIPPTPTKRKKLNLNTSYTTRARSISASTCNARITTSPAERARNSTPRVISKAPCAVATPATAPAKVTPIGSRTSKNTWRQSPAKPATSHRCTPLPSNPTIGPC